MSARASAPRAVVLLHGLYNASDPAVDPFGDLASIERDLLERGLPVLRFPWPAGFNAVMALRNPRRSFSDELAAALDDFLRQRLQDSLRDRQWAVVAHSGGGSQCFRWLVDFAPVFVQDGGSLPARVVAIAAPHKCTADRLDLPNGVRIEVHERVSEPPQIAQACPGRLVIIAAADDTTALPVDTLFPTDLVQAGVVAQHLISDAGHRDVCHHQVTRDLVRAYV